MTWAAQFPFSSLFVCFPFIWKFIFNAASALQKRVLKRKGRKRRRRRRMLRMNDTKNNNNNSYRRRKQCTTRRRMKKNRKWKIGRVYSDLGRERERERRLARIDSQCTGWQSIPKCARRHFGTKRSTVRWGRKMQRRFGGKRQSCAKSSRAALTTSLLEKCQPALQIWQIKCPDSIQSNAILQCQIELSWIVN